MEDRFYEEEELSLSQLFEVLKRRKNLIIYFFIFTVVIITGLSFLKTPIYEAKATILIDREGANVLIFRDLFTVQGGNWDQKFNSQVRMIKSHTLAKKVIKKLNLEGELSAGLRVQNPNIRLSMLVKRFLSHLKVQPIPKTRLVEVKYRDTDPKRAAQIVNTLVDEFIKFTIELKGESARRASEYLTEQIEKLRRNLAEKEKELQKYSQRKDLYYLTDKQNTIIQKFAQLNNAYTKAQINRVNQESFYRELLSKKYEEYPNVVNNPLIQSLKAEYSKLEAEYRQKAAIFKPDYPEMKSLRSRMQALKERIAKETRNLGEEALRAARARYLSALKAEQSLKQLLDEQKKQMSAANTSSIYYNSLKIEVKNMRNLLEHLTKKQKESLLSANLEGMRTSNIKIVDRAEVPLIPVSPDKKLNFLLAVLLGLSGGIFLAFVVDALDNSIKSPEEVEKLFRLPVLGVTPNLNGAASDAYGRYYGKKKRKGGGNTSPELIVIKDPESQFAELIKTITTSILLSKPKSPPKVLTITSSMPKEGKTTIATNLALSLATLQKKVLLVDGDLRRPMVHKVFNISNKTGLSTLMSGRSTLSESVKVYKGNENIFLLPAGPIPPNPVELLNSSTMEKFMDYAREKFDHVIMDAPPLVGISDPMVLAKMSDGVIVVIWAGKTTRKRLEDSISLLRKYDISPLGIIVNRIGYRGSYYYYDYYGYYYYGEGSAQSHSSET